ncbi:hypothetical protein CsSME_00024728 [Camellia sinensis var. sinensis]
MPSSWSIIHSCGGLSSFKTGHNASLSKVVGPNKPSPLAPSHMTPKVPHEGDKVALSHPMTASKPERVPIDLGQHENIKVPLEKG